MVVVGHGREGIAFISTAVAILSVAVITFLTMVPGMGFAAANGSRAVADLPLTIMNASSSEGTLVLMTIVAVIFVPIVLAYTSWTYWVFRQRLGVENMPDEVALAS